MSQTANDQSSKPGESWWAARNQLFRMIKQGRSFSGNERNGCFLNLGASKALRKEATTSPNTAMFATAAGVSGIDFPDDGRALAVVDWDQDGDLDFWTSNRNAPRLRLLTNQAATEGNWLSLRLEGNGESTNRDAIGAQVEVHIGRDADRPRIETVVAGNGFLSQSSMRVHFGLGSEGDIDRIVVDWPGGDRETFRGIEANHRYHIRQGSASVPPAIDRAIDRSTDSRRVTDRADSAQATPVPSQLNAVPVPAHIALMHRPVAPNISYRTSDGSATRCEFPADHPTLVTVWASWCEPCLTELTQWYADKRSQTQFQILALSVDQLGETPTKGSVVKSVAERISPNLNWGYLDESGLDSLQSFHDLFFFHLKPLPLPTTFLVDRQGHVVGIYKGPVSLDRVEADLERSDLDYHSGMQAAAVFPGSTIANERVEATAKQGELQTMFRVANWHESRGNYRQAIAQFQSLRLRAPEFDLATQHLAKLYLMNGQLPQSAEYAKQTIKLNPKNARAYNTLGLVASRTRQQAKAIAYLTTAIRIDDQFAEAHNNLAVELASSGAITKAIPHWKSAVELDPSFAEALTNLGSAYLAQRKPNLAMQYYRQAIAADADYVDAYLNLGTVFAQSNRLEDAVKLFEKVLEITPDHRAGRANLQRAQTLLRQQNR